MKGGILYSRVIPADKDRGYVLLMSWEKPVVQRTCYVMSSMSAPSRASLDSMIEDAARRGGADKVVDVTESGIVKKLAKLFGEVPEKIAKVNVPKIS